MILHSNVSRCCTMMQDDWRLLKMTQDDSRQNLGFWIGPATLVSTRPNAIYTDVFVWCSLFERVENFHRQSWSTCKTGESTINTCMGCVTKRLKSLNRPSCSSGNVKCKLGPRPSFILFFEILRHTGFASSTVLSQFTKPYAPSQRTTVTGHKVCAGPEVNSGFAIWSFGSLLWLLQPVNRI